MRASSASTQLGACGTCEGRGIIHTDLAFMDPVTTTCHDCEGRRFREEVLRLTVRGSSIADVLEMTAEQALEFFDDTGVRRRLHALRDVGLTYLTLGQPLSTLSGGERQRIKLATRLHRTGAVYVLDEPTTGLHMADVEGLARPAGPAGRHRQHGRRRRAQPGRGRPGRLGDRPRSGRRQGRRRDRLRGHAASAPGGSGVVHRGAPAASGAGLGRPASKGRSRALKGRSRH